MMLKTDLEEQFDQYGVTITDEIVEKCLELCEEHNISNASEFVENWMAYTINKLNGADPKPSTIEDMVRQEYENTKKTQRTDDTNDETLKIYGIESKEIELDDNIMDSYIEPTSPKRKKVLPTVTAKTPNGALFSPASFQPLSEGEKKEKIDSGKVLCSFGRAQLIKDCQWKHFRNGNVKIKLSGKGEFMNESDRYMVDTLSMRSTIQYDEMRTLGKEIFDKIRPEERGEETIEKIFKNTSINVPSTKAITAVGRLITLKDEKISPKNVTLVGLDPEEFHMVKLDLSNCQNYSLYPGQVVLVRGKNENGDTILVDWITSATEISFSQAPIIKNVPLSIVATSGPYTANDNLSFQPLQDLVKYCHDNPPDILIMTGPFLNANNASLTNMADRFDAHFERIIEQLVNNLESQTHILIISSHEDINSTFVYPTHPYRCQQRFENVHFLPDPCIVDIEGVQIGITSTDTISTMSDNELSFNEGADAIKRSIFHMFHKKSFYPIRPGNVPLDVGLAQRYAKLSALPNLLILPSDVKEFIRDYNNCLTINPGRLHKGQETGTFARIVLHPTDSPQAKFFNYVAGQVVKI
ncbi:DNA polymerase alpha subunit B [Culicoides brevitarsis]|uniref:DNA polymerase alpha subunit B n=1 Tax=Culicoides brevitarsis TaxID=469753 RepID=UPI00307B3547